VTTSSRAAEEISDERGRELALLDTEYVVPEETVANLHAHGWARLPGLLDAAVVTELRERLAAEPLRPLDALGKSYRGVGADAPASTDAEPVQFLDHELDSKHNQNHEGMAWRNEFFRRVGTSRRIAGTAVQLMRREQAVFIQDISFFKPGGGGSPTAMHQDYASWPFDRKGAITIWIALIDVAANMGPLAYLEDSHLEGPLGLAGRLQGGGRGGAASRRRAGALGPDRARRRTQRVRRGPRGVPDPIHRCRRDLQRNRSPPLQHPWPADRAGARGQSRLPAGRARRRDRPRVQLSDRRLVTEGRTRCM
jgi:hypothetical protein